MVTKRYSYRAYPTPGQERSLARLFGCVRVAYNAAVNILVAAGLAETVNACGADVRRALARAVGSEAGTHRSEVAA